MTSMRRLPTTAGFELRVMTAPVISLARAIVWIGERRRARRAVAEMMALDARMLADIGLERYDIVYAARFGNLPRRQSRLGRG